jgi:hypothetical protein
MVTSSRAIVGAPLHAGLLLAAAEKECRGTADAYVAYQASQTQQQQQ